MIDNNPKYADGTRVQFGKNADPEIYTGRIIASTKQPIPVISSNGHKKNRILYRIDGDDGKEHLVYEGYIHHSIK